MWIWILILIILIVVYWIYDFVKDGISQLFNSGSAASKLILAAIVSAIAFAILGLITGLGIMGALARLSLALAVVIAVVRFIQILFRK